MILVCSFKIVKSHATPAIQQVVVYTHYLNVDLWQMLIRLHFPLKKKPQKTKTNKTKPNKLQTNQKNPPKPNSDSYLWKWYYM